MAWVGLSICVNALYEIRHPHPVAGHAVPDLLVNFMFWLLIVALIALTSIASLSPVFPTPRKTFQWTRDAFMHYIIMFGSIICTIAVAIISAIVHFTTQP
jgi:hypothetical protein